MFYYHISRIKPCYSRLLYKIQLCLLKQRTNKKNTAILTHKGVMRLTTLPGSFYRPQEGIYSTKEMENKACAKQTI